MTLHGSLMVCGTTSDAGKSTIVAGLCRVLARKGISVAPFKAQNMALNSAVTRSGHEIGRAQLAQARAAGIEADVAMNPVLLKPTSERASQVVVEGRPWAVLDAATYHRRKPELLDVVARSLEALRSRYDVVLCEGAGSPAEINLLDGDLVNLGLARRAAIPAIVVGDIERGGVFAALFGTVALLPDELSRLVKGFVINKFRGDPALLGDGPAELERRSGVPTLGVLPWLAGPSIDAEDSLGLDGITAGSVGNHPPVAGRPAPLDVAAVRFPRISNFTDLEALALEPGVALRLVTDGRALGRPDLVVLPGTKATVADLAWLRATGLAAAITGLVAGGHTTVIGICGGHQMLGRRITDPVESGSPAPVEGLGLLDTETVFEASKVTRNRSGLAFGCAVSGYQIHHGRTTARTPWVVLDREEPEGNVAAGGAVVGTSLHGLWEADAFREAFLRQVAERAGREWLRSGMCFEAARQARFDGLADLLEAHVDLDRLERLIAEGVRSR